MSNQLISVPFHNESLTAVLVDDVPYISMKVICDNIGLQWKPQLKRIQRHPVLSKGVSMMDTPTKGGMQKVLTLPLKLVNGWLFGVDANRIKNSEIKQRVITYQEECFDVLANHFLPKRNALVVLPKLTPKQQRHIQKRVSTLVHEQIGTTHYALWGKVRSCLVNVFPVKSSIFW